MAVAARLIEATVEELGNRCVAVRVCQTCAQAETGEILSILSGLNSAGYFDLEQDPENSHPLAALAARLQVRRGLHDSPLLLGWVCCFVS